MTETIYGREYRTLVRIERAECWNYTHGQYTNIEVGELIQVEHAYDANHTTISCRQADGSKLTNEIGRPLLNADGVPSAHEGYRFIVPNDALSLAIGVEIGKTYDLVGELMAYEAGESKPARVKKLFKVLNETGVGKQLQGHYSSRMPGK